MTKQASLDREKVLVSVFVIISLCLRLSNLTCSPSPRLKKCKLFRPGHDRDIWIHRERDADGVLVWNSRLRTIYVNAKVTLGQVRRRRS